MACHHYSGDLCIVCGDPCNPCCGKDRECGECEAVMCQDCFGENECPSCSGKIITKDRLINHLLKRLGITLQEAEDQIREMNDIIKPFDHKNKTYVYAGDPKKYDPSNDYDAARIFENGDMISPELIDDADAPIYVILNDKVDLSDINEIMKHATIYYAKDFQK